MIAKTLTQLTVTRERSAKDDAPALNHDVPDERGPPQDYNVRWVA